MKKLLILIPFLLFAFEVEYTKIYTQYIVPKKDAILIKTKKELTFPFKYKKVPNGYILYGDIDSINMWLENDFYAPEDAKFENIKIAIVDMDKIQAKIIRKINRTYQNCSIKKIEFLTPDENQIITHPITIKEKFKITLNCR